MTTGGSATEVEVEATDAVFGGASNTVVNVGAARLGAKLF